VIRSVIYPGLLLLLLATGCRPEPDYGDFVARVGNATLTREELARILDRRTYSLDSTEAASQIVEQWTTNELLYQDALQRGLRMQPEVARLLAENERSVLISALVNELYAEEADAPSEGAIQTYYEQHREQLLLREPYARVHYIPVRNATVAALVRDSLRRSSEPSNFERLVMNHSTDPETSMALADAYFPVSQLFSRTPALRSALLTLRPGDVLGPVEQDSIYHVVRLMDRVAAGTLPELEMIRPEIVQRVQIESRKQLFARQVQRLRTQALAREELEIK
jgi:parvulin-like peptidyl-prolyl isomerase